METLIYDSVGEIEEEWKSYFPSHSLMGDYPLACYIEKNLFNFCTKEVKVVIFFDGKVRGIMPLSLEEREEKRFWTYYPGVIFTASPISIDPCCWPFLDRLPKPFCLEETSWLSIEKARGYLPSWFKFKPSNIIHLNKPFPEYFQSLDKKARSTFKNISNRNSDIEVVAEEPEPEAFKKISKIYYDYCVENFTQDLQCQLYMFPEIFKTACQFGKLVVLSFYLKGELIAVNYGILNEDNTCFCDYICYRNSEDLDLKKRSLGIFAILENIKHIQEKYGCEWYDLASDFEYKKPFVNCEKYHVTGFIDVAGTNTLRPSSILIPTIAVSH